MRQTVWKKELGGRESRGRIALVGYAADGPVGRPFTLVEGVDPEQVLGTCELAEAFRLALASGLAYESIVLVRLNGEHGSESLLHSDGRALLRLASIGANDRDNGIVAMVMNGVLTIRREEGEGVVWARTYRLEDHGSVDALCVAIERERLLGFHEVQATVIENLQLGASDWMEGERAFYTAMSEEFLSDPFIVSDEYAAEQFVERAGRYLIDEEGLLEGGQLEVEAIQFVGIRPDHDLRCLEIAGRIAEQLSEGGIVTVAGFDASMLPSKVVLVDEDGIMEDGSPTDDLLTEEGEAALRYDEARSRMSLLSGASIEASGDVFVFYGRAQAEGFQVGVGTSALARFVQLMEDQELRNKPLDVPYAFPYELGKEELAWLEGSGYTCIVPSVRRGPVVHRLCRLHTYKEDMREDVTTRRLLSFMALDLEENLSEWIGSLGGQQEEEISRRVEERLIAFQSRGWIRDARFSVESEGLERKIVNMELTLHGRVDRIRLRQEVQFEAKEVFRWMQA